MPKFRLKTMFVCVTVIAILLAIPTTVDYLAPRREVVLSLWFAADPDPNVNFYKVWLYVDDPESRVGFVSIKNDFGYNSLVKTNVTRANFPSVYDREFKISYIDEPFLWKEHSDLRQELIKHFDRIILHTHASEQIHSGILDKDQLN